MKEAENFLKDKGVTPTPVRMLVYSCLRDSAQPMSLSDIETKLESVDKSTISRTLSTFREKHLVHAFSDGSGSVKYEVCTSQKESEDEDMHVHFHCESCGSTLCLTNISIPHVVLPSGYVAHGVTYLITGVCDRCK